MKPRLRLTCLAFFLCAMGSPAHSWAWPTRAASPVSAVVVQVSDGDTVWLQSVNGKRWKLRIEGIDAPEICQPWGRQSRKALMDKTLHREVTVLDARKQDDYHRGLSRLSFQGEDLGAWMVNTGNAWSYRFHNDPGPYPRQEAQARNKKIGLWETSNPTEPRQFRKIHGPCEG